ncbi:hypothetical protein [Olsenella uli]|uniref:hypothetical protein n=1 Tax=Olsenella uli TaxID=133926 RepID=UPI001650E1AE|nr:hypothetical protein [Olsenella uli]
MRTFVAQVAQVAQVARLARRGGMARLARRGGRARLGGGRKVRQGAKDAGWPAVT